MNKHIRKLSRKTTDFTTWIGRTTGESFVIYLVLNILLVLFQLIYIFIRFKYINSDVPFLYTKPWGDQQLANKLVLYYVPLLSAAITTIGIIIYYQSKKYFFMYLDRIAMLVVTVTNIFLTLSLIRIIFIASSPFDPLINPLALDLLLAFIAAFALAFAIAPRFIRRFRERGIVTDPGNHQHPGMMLVQPSTRGGGLIFATTFLIVCVVLVGFSKILFGIYLGVLLIAVLGMIDDYQNTHPSSKLKIIENPIVRLSLLSLIVLIPIAFGVRIDFINNPFNGFVDFTQHTIEIASITIHWAAIAFTLLWVVWLINVLSWSNGVDGQYGGIVGIACIVIAILALRFVPPGQTDLQMAKIAIVASGAAWGLMKYTWYPSKVLWGFGAMAAGLIIATTSVVIGSKIAVSVIIILIPFLDAIITIIRRLAQGKNPLRGDKNHLHHFLYKQGWGVRRIAIFYWLTTAVFGFIGIVSADKEYLLLTLTLIGLGAFATLALIVSLQLRDRLKRQQTA